MTFARLSRIPIALSRVSRATSPVLVLVLGLLLPGSGLNAQTIFGTITGTVTDSSGAVVPNATVTATLVANALKTTTQSNGVGIYNFANMTDGEYQITATAHGFQQEVLTGITLLPRQLLRVDVKLQVGSVTQETVVTATVGLIETDAPTLSATVTNKDLQTSPLAQYIGGGALRTLAMEPTYNQTIEGNTSPSFAGSRDYDYKVLFDGIDTDNGSGSSNALNLMSQVEAFQEVKTDYVNNSAEFPTLVQVQLVSKSGTNDLHGSIVDYYSDMELMAARSFFSTTAPTGNQQDWGFYVGGPVYIPKLYNGKNKTFFFLNYFHIHIPTQNIVNATVPLTAWRQGDFSALGVPITNPLTGQVYPNGVIPQNTLNPVSLALQNTFYPAPNYGNTSVFSTGNFRTAEIGAPTIETFPMLRLDQVISAKDSFHLTFEYFQEKFIQTQNGGLPLGNWQAHYARPQKIYNVDYSHIFTSNMVNEFKFGGSSDVAKYQSPFGSGLAFDQSLGVTGLAPNVPSNIQGYPSISFSNGITSLSQYGFNRSVSAIQSFVDSLSYFHGRHAFKFGGDIGRFWSYAYSANGTLFGSESFNPTYSGSNSALAYADFLLGVPTTSSIAYAPIATYPHRTAQGYFATDTWKATPKLTVTIGLRWEYFGIWREKNNLISAFDQALGAIVVPPSAISKVSPLMPTNYVPIISTTQAHVTSNMYNPDMHEFAPRIGIAYRPWGNKTVFRAGYGIFFGTWLPKPTTGGVPYLVSVPSYTNPRLNPTVVFPNFFPLTGNGSPSTVSLPTALNPNLRMPYTEQWNFTIEHEMGGFGLRASVFGTDGRQIIWQNNINVPAISSTPYISKPRPFANYPAIYDYLNGGNHDFTGLNLQVLRRFKNGLSFTSAFAWVRDIGDDPAEGAPQNPYCLACDRAVEGYDPTLAFTNNVTYQLPFGHGQKFLAHMSKPLNAVFGGWQLTIFEVLKSGTWGTPTVTVPDPTGTAYTASSTPATVTIRPDVLVNPNLPNPKIAQWYNTTLCTATSSPAGCAWGDNFTGRFGSSGLNLIKEYGANAWHANLEKIILLSENPRAPRFRLDLYVQNLLNHPNWGAPGLSLTSPASAGVVTSLGGSSSGSFGTHADIARTPYISARLDW